MLQVISVTNPTPNILQNITPSDWEKVQAYIASYSRTLDALQYLQRTSLDEKKILFVLAAFSQHPKISASILTSFFYTKQGDKHLQLLLDQYSQNIATFIQKFLSFCGASPTLVELFLKDKDQQDLGGLLARSLMIAPLNVAKNPVFQLSKELSNLLVEQYRKNPDISYSEIHRYILQNCDKSQIRPPETIDFSDSEFDFITKFAPEAPIEKPLRLKVGGKVSRSRMVAKKKGEEEKTPGSSMTMAGSITPGAEKAFQQIQEEWQAEQDRQVIKQEGLITGAVTVEQPETLLPQKQIQPTARFDEAPADDGIYAPESMRSEEVFGRAPAYAPEKRMAAKKSRGIFSSLLSLPFVLIGAVITGLFRIVSFSFQALFWVLSQPFQLIILSYRKWREYLENAASKEHRLAFEVALSEDAGRPGPLEHSLRLLSIFLLPIYRFFGLRILIFIHLCDRVLEFFTSYLHSIYQTWKLMRTVKRKLQRKVSGREVMDLEKDVAFAKVQLARVLMISGFYLEEHSAEMSYAAVKRSQLILSLVMDMRDHFDQMLRDLDLINVTETVAVAKQSLWDFLKSLIPNPLDFLTIWKDVAILCFFAKYSRKDIDIIFYRWFLSYQNLHKLMLKEALFIDSQFPQEKIYDQRLAEEVKKFPALLEFLDGFSKSEHITEITPENRMAVRRLFPLLCLIHQVCFPDRWNRCDLLREFTQMKDFERIHPYVYLEWFVWLHNEVWSSLKKKKQISAEESRLYLRDQQKLKQYYRTYRKFYEYKMLF